ncbi:MAG: cation-transporting P-type ATPase [Enhygromyxa sp.]
MQTLLNEHWHELPAPEVVRLLDSDPDRGLDWFETSRRRERFGSNTLTVRRAESRLLAFLRQFHQPLVYILLAAGAITAALREWIDSSVIFGVVLVNSVVGYLQESKARQAIESLAASMSTEATVIRAGEKRRIDAAEVVVGDIVLLASGDRVPADLRLIRARELRLDESSLTGESVPVEKHPAPLSVETPLADRQNIAYSSTLVAFGTGTGVVVAIGDDTEIGRIQELVSSAEVLATPLTRKIAKFSSWLLYAILALAGLSFAVGGLRGEPMLDMFMAAVALTVAAIPEGLPAAMTITLAIGVSKMARRNAIIRRLPAVETLGSTTVICSDKTGTLTENQMTVRCLATVAERFEVSGGGYDAEGEILRDGAAIEIDAHPRIRELLIAGIACNDSRVIDEGEGRRVDGDPTEAALIVVAGKAGLTPEGLREWLPRVDAIPFESERQYMATLHEAGDEALIYLKGSVERVLERCESIYDPREPAPLDAARVRALADELGGDGLRVLAFARKPLAAKTRSIGHSEVAEGFSFLGLQALIDPPRRGVAEAIAVCQRAGIQVKMVTGDHAKTAVAIAERLAISGVLGEDGKLQALTGPELDQLSDDELIGAAHRIAVFARVAPEQKLRLVQALQTAHRHAHVVAMTGDGVNDAPALRRADIGVAMGEAGTETAKEAADMVLADDNFATLEAAVEEGRGVYDNLIKFITWTLPTNLGEGLVILIAVLAGLQMPITPVQVLWINMTTAIAMGMMLAFEPKEPGIMDRHPRAPHAPILSKTLLGRIVLVGLLLLAGAFGLHEFALIRGHTIATAQTVAVNVFVFGELFYLFNCRSLTHSMFHVGVFSNPWLLVGGAVMIVLQVGFTHVPFMHVAFGSEALDPLEWGTIIAVGVLIYGIVGIEKAARRRWGG